MTCMSRLRGLCTSFCFWTFIYAFFLVSISPQYSPTINLHSYCRGQKMHTHTQRNGGFLLVIIIIIGRPALKLSIVESLFPYFFILSQISLA
jgi:hypothetical protein